MCEGREAAEFDIFAIRASWANWQLISFPLTAAVTILYPSFPKILLSIQYANIAIWNHGKKYFLAHGLCRIFKQKFWYCYGTHSPRLSLKLHPSYIDFDSNMQIYFPVGATVAQCPVVMQAPMCKVRCLLAFCFLGYNFLQGKEKNRG